MHAFSLFMHSGDSIAAITDAFAAKLNSDMRADVLGNRLREGAIGSLIGAMVSDVSRGEAIRQYSEQVSGLNRLFEATPEALGEIANPSDFTERDLRTLVGLKQRHEADFCIASGGGGVRPRGRPSGYVMTQESRAKIGQTRRAKQTGAAAEAMIERGNSSIPAFSVSEFGCLDPQPHPFAANQPWQPNHFAVPPDCMLTPFPGFSPQMQHSPPVCAVNCQDFGGSMVASQMRSVSALPVYAPPIHPSIIVQFLLSPDYSLL
jgi:hypothetical protein